MFLDIVYRKAFSLQLNILILCNSSFYKTKFPHKIIRMKDNRTGLGYVD